MTLRLLDTFSGIGGFSLAARWLGGFETVQFVERDPYCQRVLAKHWPTIPIHNDICTFNPKRGTADVIVGGFPCQDISTAGKGAGLAGERSGLFYELLRVVRMVGPRYVVLENVAAITHRGMDAVLGALAEAGYDAEWACIPAAAVGACHRRDRWWCVAYAQGARRAAQQGQGQDRAGHGRAGSGDGDTGSDAADSNGRGQRRQSQIDNPAGALDIEPGNDYHGLGLGEIPLLLSALSCKSDSPFASYSLHGRHGHDLAVPPQRREDKSYKAGLSGGGSAWPQQWPAWEPGREPLRPDWRTYVSEPVLRRGDDGLSGRVDRLRALGNAVVPQVAMVPLARVLELEQQLQGCQPP